MIKRRSGSHLHGLRVCGLAPQDVHTPWPNTYGIWRDEIDELGLAHLLGPRWTNCVVYAGGRRHDLGREYGLFDNSRLQAHLLARGVSGVKKVVRVFDMISETELANLRAPSQK